MKMEYRSQIGEKNIHFFMKNITIIQKMIQ